MRKNRRDMDEHLLRFDYCFCASSLLLFAMSTLDNRNSGSLSVVSIQRENILETLRLPASVLETEDDIATEEVEESGEDFSTG